MSDESAERTFWDAEVQTMAPERLRELQNGRLREAVETAYAAKGFFTRRLDAAGVHPEDVRTVDDITLLPSFVKADLRANEAEHPPIGDYRSAGLDRSIRLATSTGTTGRPTIMVWNEEDLEIDYQLSARRYWRDGIRPGDVVVNAHPGYLNGGQAMIAGALEAMGCLAISIGPPVDEEGTGRALRTIEALTIDHWMLLPAGAARIREIAIKIGWKGKLPSEETMSPVRQYSAISAGMECVGTLGGSCAPSLLRGAHIAEDYAIVEAVDPVSHKPVRDGDRGLFLCTSLGRRNPMLRFDLEEVVRLQQSPCPCGETHVRGFWEGRMRDVVNVGGRWVLPIDVWFELKLGQEFVMVRTASVQDDLEVVVEGPVDDDLLDRLRSRTRVAVRLTVVEPGSLPRAAYKSERIVDQTVG